MTMTMTTIGVQYQRSYDAENKKIKTPHSAEFFNETHIVFLIFHQSSRNKEGRINI